MKGMDANMALSNENESAYSPNPLYLIKWGDEILVILGREATEESPLHFG